MEIPSINNPIWKDLIQSFENLELKSLAFQMIVIRTKERFRNGEISIENAIKILYDFCNDNKKGNNLIADIKNIFGDSVINVKFKTENTQKLEETFKEERLLKNTKSNSIEEKEKLLQKLESLDNKVKEIEESKKKTKKFFRRLF